MTKEIGLLIIRVGLGIMFISHGAPKIFGGPVRWEEIGQATQYIGIAFFPLGWGLAAALSEFAGGILFLLGLYTRYASLALAATMFVATAFHFGRGDGLMGASHALELGIVFLGMSMVGAGRFSLDAKLGKA